MEPDQAETLAKARRRTSSDPRLAAIKLRSVGARSWWYALRRAVHNFVVDLDTDVAGMLTYYAFSSLFPALLALLSLLSLIGEARSTARWILDFMARYLAADVVEVLRDPITRLTASPGAGWVLIVSIAIALWGANGYVSAFGRAMNRLHDVAEGRPFWKIIPYNLVLTAGTLLIGGVMLVTMTLSGRILRTLIHPLSLPVSLPLLDVVRWPVLVFTAMAYIAALYHLTPNVRLPRFKIITPGSVLATLGMVIAVRGVNYWVDEWSTVNATYGIVGSFIVLLLALWLVNCALLFGGEVDAELERVRELHAGIESERTLQLPPRDDWAIRQVVAAEERFVEQGRAIRERCSPPSPTEPTPESSPG